MNSKPDDPQDRAGLAAGAPNPELNLDVLVFDMDGVLIDIAHSYSQAVLDTVQLYFQRCLGLPGEALLITREDFIDFKYLGGFNDDWDLSYALVEYLLSLIDYRPRNSAFRIPHFAFRDSQAALNILQKAGSEIEMSLEELVRRKDIKSLVNRLKGKEVGLAGLRREFKGKNSGLSFCEGEVVGGNLIKRIFQELYLGGEYFKQVYHQSPLIYEEEGYLTKEVRLVKPETMKYLAERLKLGIATGRPRLDADYALEYFGLKEYFEVVLTQDDVKDRALLKPNPHKLLKVARELGAGAKTRCAYIGDLPDDVIAANRAKSELNFISIGCLAATDDKDSLRKEFEDQGADLIVEDVDELAQLIANSQ
ncbi:MAG: HAD hydrolase-like protein [bacterium]|nr:HAD hydrolase-like protein [bacterium]